MTQSISRREILAAVAAGAVAVRRSSATPQNTDAPPRFTMLDHLEFFVSDVEKSRAFYARMFGNAVLKNNRTTRRYVKLGPAYMAIDTGQQIRVDHICAGIPGFQIAAMHSFLEKRGIPYRDYPSGKDLSVEDPGGGVRLQLAADDGWNSLLGGTASTESVAIAEDPVFRPTGLDHVLLNVVDPEKSAAFYEKILGPVTRRNNDRIWFQVGPSRVGLLKTADGQRVGVNHFCVAAAPFNNDSAVRKLEEMGAKLEKPEVAGAPEFRDPDGYLVQVMASLQ
jgi:catechol 2,3-dioxygenase-like lactoylglutathione lyase family enzyme